jgi:hypothetical protein
LPPLGEADGGCVAAVGEGENPVNGRRARASSVQSDHGWASLFATDELSAGM